MQAGEFSVIINNEILTLAFLQRIVASNDGVPNHLAFNVIEPLIIVGDSKVKLRVPIFNVYLI